MFPTLWRQEVPSEGLSSLGASPTFPPSRLHGAPRHNTQLLMEVLPTVLRETARAWSVVHPVAAQTENKTVKTVSTFFFIHPPASQTILLP